MSKYTENYKLILPEQSEHYDVEVANTNNKEIDRILGDKVDKIPGKGLSTNDFSNEYEQKLSKLQNYDDKEVREAIESLNTKQSSQSTKVEKIEKDLESIKSKNTEQDKNIADIQTEQITQNADIEELKAENERLKEDLNNSTITAPPSSGENITIEGSAEARFKKLVIKGNSVQETREGYNLANLDAQTYEQNSINVTNNGDGSFTLNGTLTKNSDLYLTQNKEIEQTIYNFEQDKYVLKTEVLSGNFQTIGDVAIQTICTGLTNDAISYSMFVNNLYGNEFVKIANFADGKIRKLSRIEIYAVMKEDTATITFNNYRVRILLAKSSDADLPWQPYGAMPSPEFQSPIRNCGDNVNLFDEKKWELTDIDNGKEVLKFSGYYASGTGGKAGNPLDLPIDNIKKGETYTIFGKFKNNTYDSTLMLMFKDYSIKYYQSFKSNYEYSGFTFTIPEDKEILHLCIGAGAASNYNFVEKGTIKLEKGTKATPYSPYGCGNVNFETTQYNILKSTWAQDLLDRLGINSTDTNNCITEIDGHRYLKYQYNLGYLTSLAYFIKGGFKENTRYTFKTILMKSDNNTGANIYILYTDGTGLSLTIPQSANMTRTELKFTSATNKTIDYIGVAYNSGTTYIDLNNTILYEGIDDLPYESPRKYSFPTKQGQVFHKNDVIGDGNSYHYWKTIELTGEETIKEEWRNIEDRTHCFIINANIKDSETHEANTADILCKSTHFVGTHYDGGSGSIWEESRNNVGRPYLIAIIDRKGISSTGLIEIKHSDITTVEEMQAFLRDQKAKGTPVLVQYKLQKPIIEPFSEDQKEAYKQIKNAKTYKGTTHIFCTDEISCEFEEEHIVDLEAYINSKIGATSADTPIQEQPSIQEGPNMEEPSIEEVGGEADG